VTSRCTVNLRRGRCRSTASWRLPQPGGRPVPELGLLEELPGLSPYLGVGTRSSARWTSAVRRAKGHGPGPAITSRLAASRLTSHSHGCASPHACTASPDTGVVARSAAIGSADGRGRSERGDHHPAPLHRHELRDPRFGLLLQQADRAGPGRPRVEHRMTITRHCGPRLPGGPRVGGRTMPTVRSRHLLAAWERGCLLGQGQDARWRHGHASTHRGEAHPG
jgi:hypothetical protein